MVLQEELARWAHGFVGPLTAAVEAGKLMTPERWFERYAVDPESALALTPEGRRFAHDKARAWRALEPEARADLLLAALCEGGFDVADLQDVAGGVRLDSLHRLRREGWLAHEGERCFVPEPLRHLVRHLADDAARFAAERRHAMAYLEHADRHASRAWLERERRNLEAVIDRGRDTDPEQSVRAVLALMPLLRFAERPSALRGRLVRALDSCRAHPGLSASVRCELAGRLVDLGAFDDALRWAELSADEEVPPAVDVKLATLRGHVNVWLERYDESEREFARAALRLEQVPARERREVGAALTVQRAFLAMDRGDDDAAAVLAAATRDVECADQARMVTIGLHLTGRLHLKEGRYDDALRWLTRSRRRLAEEGDRRSVAFTDALIARAHRLDADPLAAAEVAQRAQQIAAEGFSDALELLVLVELVEAGVDLPLARERFAELEQVVPIPRLKREARAALERLDGVSLDVGPEGRFVVLGTRRVELAKHRAPRRILRRLAEEAVSRPAVPLSVDALFAAGWPGESIAPTSRVKRVHTAIWTLRKLGLERVLCTEDGAYRLAAKVRLVGTERV